MAPLRDLLSDGCLRSSSPEFEQRKCMRIRQSDYLIGILKSLAKFPAVRLAGALTDKYGCRTIDLESAAFLFHIRPTTLRIIRSLRAACSDPFRAVSGLPLSANPNRRLKHAGV